MPVPQSGRFKPRAKRIGRLKGGVEGGITRQLNPVAYTFRHILRQHRFRYHHDKPDSHNNQRHRQQQNRRRSSEDSLQAPFVDIKHPVEKSPCIQLSITRILPLPFLQYLNHQHRQQHQRDKERSKQTDRDRPRLVPEKCTFKPDKEDQRQENRDGGQGRSRHGKSDLPGTDGRRPFDRWRQWHVAIDGLEHDDRVVEQQADAKGQPAQRDDVELDARAIHHEKGEKDRNRNGDHDGKRCTDIVQKEEQDEEGEETADQQRLEQIADRIPDKGSVLAQHLNADGRVELTHLLDEWHQRVEDLDGIAAKLLLDQQIEYLLPLQQSKRNRIGLIKLYFCHISQKQDPTLSQPGDRYVDQVVKLMDPALDLHRVAVPAVAQLSG